MPYKYVNEKELCVKLERQVRYQAHMRHAHMFVY